MITNFIMYANVLGRTPHLTEPIIGGIPKLGEHDPYKMLWPIRSPTATRAHALRVYDSGHVVNFPAANGE